MASASKAQKPWYSVGPKIGYTFGRGFTAGFEVTYFPSGQDPYDRPTLHGYTVDFSHVSNGPTVFHVGAEWMYIAGIDVGPSLVFDNQGVHVAATAIGFLTVAIVPYYDLTWIPGTTTLSSIGGYIKIPVGLPSHPWN